MKLWQTKRCRIINLTNLDCSFSFNWEKSQALKWIHISRITKKASSHLGLIRRNLQFCPQGCRKMACLSDPWWNTVPFCGIFTSRRTLIQHWGAQFLTSGCDHNHAVWTWSETSSTVQAATVAAFPVAYKVVTGQFPAIPAQDYPPPPQPHPSGLNRRPIRPRTIKD